MKNCYIFDVDGTLADVAHRLHFIQGVPKRWDEFNAACIDDPPIKHVCHVAWALHREEYHSVIFVSGRSDQVREQTLSWLIKNIDWSWDDPPILHMRRAGDYREDHVIKGEILDMIVADGYNPVAVFDDRTQVVKMWRARGIPCFQVADRDF